MTSILTQPIGTYGTLSITEDKGVVTASMVTAPNISALGVSVTVSASVGLPAILNAIAANQSNALLKDALITAATIAGQMA